MKRSTIRLTIITLGAALTVGACSDGRPQLAEAERWFRSTYPDAFLVAVRNTQDEVVATSFLFRYELPRGSIERSIDVQFMRDDRSGAWRPSPAAPARLP